jgi:hypothetical protein
MLFGKCSTLFKPEVQNGYLWRLAGRRPLARGLQWLSTINQDTNRGSSDRNTRVREFRGRRGGDKANTDSRADE